MTAWDARGYATSVAGTAMVVNGDGARVKESVNNLLRDGSDVLAGVLSDGGATYVPGLSERRSGNTTYMHGGMKSAEARTSSSGSVSGTRVYDAFGQTVGSTGTWAGPSGYGGRFGYREDGTGLRLLGHRLYDPAAGRFVSRDPARDGGNWYAYCGGDPVNCFDGTGEFPFLIIAAVLIVGALTGGCSKEGAEGATTVPPGYIAPPGGSEGAAGAPAAGGILQIRERMREKDKAGSALLEEGAQDDNNKYDEGFDHQGNPMQNPNIFRTDPNPSLPIFR